MKNLITQVTLQLSILACSLPSHAYCQSVINRSIARTDKAGVLEPFKSTEVATAEMGVVREIFVKAGDRVEAGNILGRLDNEQQQKQVREAEFEANASGTLEIARSEVAFNVRRVEESLKRIAANKGSPKELERDQLELNIATAKLHAQEEAKLISQARLEKAQIILSERSICAPHKGIVVEVYRDVGEYVAGNAPAIVRLQDTSKLRARFFLSDEMAERFRKMDHAEIRLTNHVVLKATIEFIAPFAIAEGNVIEMTLLIDNENGSIRSSSCELVLP